MINLRNALMAGKRLPYDAEAEYLESTGTQWIDTGVACAFDYTYTIVAGHNELTAGSSALFGVAWAVRSVFVQMSVPPRDFYWHGINPSQYYSFTSGAMDTISFGNGFVTVNGTTTTGTAYLNANAGLPITLFGNAAYYGSTTGPAKVRIGRFTITNANNKKILDLIPVRVGTVGYLYDHVSGKLFGNAGTGDFTLGPDKN